MAKEYTQQDVPMTLNSISWQLKRIADSLENIDNRLRNQEIHQMYLEERAQYQSTKLRDLLDKAK